MARYASAGGVEYAGPCELTRSPGDIGKLCSRFVVQRGALVAYLVGRTFSEFSRWLLLEERGVTWAVIADVPLDFQSQALVPPWPR